MPPRIRGPSAIIPPVEAWNQPPPTPSSAAPFSTSAPRQLTRPQRSMRQWMERSGQQLQKATPGRPNYLGGSTNQPFPLNPSFRSQPVLSEELREEIWKQIMKGGDSATDRAKTIKEVSARFSVDMRRVAAVVRLKEVEKQWEAQGKPLAKPYARAVMDMLPQTRWNPKTEYKPHESINDLHVHSRTMQQLFFPTSESRHFTREDAAKVFGDKMLSADKRVPMPELIQYEKDLLAGKTPQQAEQAFEKAARESEEAIMKKRRGWVEREEAKISKVDSGRFEFRFQAINAEDSGPDGRSRTAVGWRYGVPFHDRKKGEVKIPTKVD